MRGILFLLLLFSAAASAQDTEPADTLDTDGLLKELPEVMVTGEQPVARLERGNLIFDMKQLQRQMPADNAYDLLKRIPGVWEQNGTFTVAGQSVTLIINGRPLMVPAEQLNEMLKSVPADMLKSAEVMSAAPPEYGIRGAVINVVIGGEDKNMLTGQLQGTWNIDKYSRGYGKGALFYKHGKFSIDAVYSYLGGKTYAQMEDYALQPLQTGIASFYDKIENRSNSNSHNYTIDTNYDFAENNSLNITYTGSWSSSHAHNSTSQGDEFSQRGVSHTYLNCLDGQYTAPFGLTLRAAWLLYKCPQEQKLAGSIMDEDKSRTAESRQHISKWMFSANQTHSFQKQWDINYGAKLSLTNQKSWQTTVSPDGKVITNGTANVDYTERVLNAYAGFTKSWGQSLSFQASAEVENYHTPNINNWRVYPVANLFYMADKNNLLNLSLSSNSSFPSYWSMMNTTYYSTVYEEIQGNPDLAPEHDYSVSILWRFRQKYILSAFANFSQDIFLQLPYQPSDRMALIMKEQNWNYRHLFGLQAVAQFNAGDRFNGNVSATLLYIHDKDNNFYDIPFNRNAFSGMFRANLSYMLWKAQNLMLIVNPSYQTKALQGVYDIKAAFFLYASMQWASQDGHWSVIASCDNITNGKITTHDTWENQNYKMKIWQRRTFALTLTYKFGKYQEKQRNEPDMSRMGH